MFAPVCRGGPWPSRGGTRQGRPGRYGTGPYMGCLRRRGVCGRGMPLPYMPSGNDRPNGIATAARANVGRDALIPPGPAAAGMFPVLNFNGAAGVNARPTDRGNTAATRENTIPAVHRRGGFHIRPVCGGAGFRGRDKSRPYGQILRFGPPKRPRQHAPLIPHFSFPHSPFSSPRSAYPTPCTVRILSAQPSLRRRRWMWVSSVRVVSAASSSPQTASYR